MSNIRLWRVVAGFVLAPLAPGVLISLIMGLRSGLDADMVGVIAAIAFFSYPVALVFGIPAHYLCRHRRWTGLSIYILFGLVLGAVPYFLSALVVGFGRLIGTGDRAAGELGTMMVTALPVLAIGAIAGLVAGASFWVIAVKKFNSSPGEN